MANIVDANLSAVLPTTKLDFLKSYFCDNPNETECFFRTWIKNISVESNDKGMSLINLSFQCAWSIEKCLLKKHEEKDGVKYSLLGDVIDKCDIRRLTILASEKGIGFEESITYIKGTPFIYNTRELCKDPLDEYLKDNDIYESHN